MGGDSSDGNSEHDMSKVKFKQIVQKGKRGWSDWILPVMKGYLMQCCDCGLVHELEFKTVVKSRYKGENIGVEMPSVFRVKFRARRKNLKK